MTTPHLVPRCEFETDTQWIMFNTQLHHRERQARFGRHFRRVLIVAALAHLLAFLAFASVWWALNFP